MRKFLSILVIAVFFLSPLGVAQEEIKADKTTEAEQDKVLSTLETAKNGQVDIEKTPEQLAKEKEALEAKKAKLAGDIPPEQREDPEDRRSRPLFLTEKGDTFVEIIHQHRTQTIKAFLSGLSINEQEQLISLLDRAISALEADQIQNKP